MTAPNHVVGGVVFTGVFGAIVGINILESPSLILVTVLSSLLADIDHPRSVLGRTLKPLSSYLNRHFGHRTITHSIFCLMALSLLCGLIENFFGASRSHTIVFSLAYFSHLLFDMMTVQGVPLFYPYKKNPCVIPGDPRNRFRTDNIKSEIGIFCFFVFAGFFLQPLMANGFWTSYNRLFGTMKHCYSEFRKSEDLLEIDYAYRIASNRTTGKGFMVSGTESKMTLWNENGWLVLDNSNQIIEEAIPSHTKKDYDLHKVAFVDISKDSLHQLLNSYPIYSLDLSGNVVFQINLVNQEGATEIVKNTFSAELIESLQVVELSSDEKPETLSFTRNPRIETLREKIRMIRKSYQADSDDYETQVAQLAQLRAKIQDETDTYLKQKLVEEVQIKQKRLKKPILQADRIAELETEIRELKERDRIKYAESVAETEAEYQASLAPKLKLTGVATFLRIK